MNKSDAAKLLALISAYDRRTLGEADVEAWHAAFESGLDERVRFDDAKKAVSAHYAETRQWMMPVDVIDFVKLLRRTRLAKIPLPPPPDHVVDESGYPDQTDPAKRQAWLDLKRPIVEAIENGVYKDDPPADVLRRSMAEVEAAGAVESAWHSLPAWDRWLDGGRPRPAAAAGRAVARRRAARARGRPHPARHELRRRHRRVEGELDPAASCGQQEG